MGLTITSGSSRPVGRITCSTIWVLCLPLKVAGGGRDEDHLVDLAVELVKVQRAVVKGRGAAGSRSPPGFSCGRSRRRTYPAPGAASRGTRPQRAGSPRGSSPAGYRGALPAGRPDSTAGVVLNPLAKADLRAASQYRTWCAASMRWASSSLPCSLKYCTRSSSLVLDVARWPASSSPGGTM